jgi:putative ABC transport system permease protein
VRDAALPVTLGAPAGVAAAALATRVIESFLFETSPTDPLTLAAVTGALATAGCLAAVVPALRAAQVDPASSLRAE